MSSSALLNSKLMESNELTRYVMAHSLRLNQHQKKMIDYTLRQEESIMLGALDNAQHFQVILKAMNAKKCLEVGCFTGATTLTIAQALPEDGRITTLDVSDECVAKDIWREAGVDHKVKKTSFLPKSHPLFFLNKNIILR
jgi:O-methyltransferase